MVHWEGSPTGFGKQAVYNLSRFESDGVRIALHYPYVLAFEPTFVEVRHVETGLMSQVIQGSNLRLLFADTPPSTTNTAGNMHYKPQQGGYGYHSFPSARGNIRQSAYGGYGPPPYGPQSNQYARAQHGVSRDEIIVVSDDRVLSLRTTAGTQLPISDSASMVSIPR
jgi:hypothetical protein